MIVVVGVGPGNPNEITLNALKWLKNATTIYGIKRHLLVIKHVLPDSATKFIDYGGNLKVLFEALDAYSVTHKKDSDHYVAILASGDPLLYGIGSTIRERYNDVQIVSGISSLFSIFTRIECSMNDVFFTSAHGREPNFKQWLMLDKVACVTDRHWNPSAIVKHYFDLGFEDRYTFFVGENLGYPNERIVSGKCRDLMDETFDNLCVVVIIRER